MGALMTDHEALLRKLYDGFNARDIPCVLSHLAQDVAWANGMDGGHVVGHEAIRAYWTAQWAAIVPNVEPLRFAERDDGSTAVDVHQVVKNAAGEVLLDETVRHVFRIERKLVTRFDIENPGGLSRLRHP